MKTGKCDKCGRQGLDVEKVEEIILENVCSIERCLGSRDIAQAIVSKFSAPKYKLVKDLPNFPKDSLDEKYNSFIRQGFDMAREAIGTLKFSAPRVDEKVMERLAYQCVASFEGHIITLDGEQIEQCKEAIASAIAKELNGGK